MDGLTTALREARVLYLDTAPLIYAIEDHPTFGPVVGQVLEAVDVGRVRAVSSTLALAEILVQPYRRGRADLVARYREILAGSPNLQLLALDDRIAAEAARIRASLDIRLPDAAHLATAVVAGADTFVTNDVRLRPFREVRVVLLRDLLG
ncbi:hypothetical protein HRbin12_00419 [bacterium HR12]|nr:hypothetical protein HRbin12_00419 [bacterium HR12]